MTDEEITKALAERVMGADYIWKNPHHARIGFGGDKDKQVCIKENGRWKPWQPLTNIAHA